MGIYLVIFGFFVVLLGAIIVAREKSSMKYNEKIFAICELQSQKIDSLRGELDTLKKDASKKFMLHAQDLHHLDVGLLKAKGRIDSLSTQIKGLKSSKQKK